jgi:hypothetical protein
MTAETLGLAAAATFLRAWTTADAAHLTEVEAYRDGPGRAASSASRAAIDLGIRLLRERQAWRRELLAEAGEADET